MEVATLLFDRLTALDAVGPYEVLSRVPGARVRWVAAEPGPKRTDAGLVLMAEEQLEDVGRPEVVVVPGGIGSRSAMRHPEILRWLREVHRSSLWTTSVCTGSLILAAAGILRGLPATSHWSQLEGLAEFGAQPQQERIVRAGKVITAAGVSAGIDMALRLVSLIAGDDVARAIQLAIEYDPDPPFDTGSPLRAPPEIVQLVRGAIASAESSEAEASQLEALGGSAREADPSGGQQR